MGMQASMGVAARKRVPLGWHAAPGLPSLLIFRQCLARIVLPTGEVGEAVVLEPGAGPFHTDLLPDHAQVLACISNTHWPPSFLSPSSACPASCLSCTSAALQWSPSFLVAFVVPGPGESLIPASQPSSGMTPKALE